MTTEDYASKIHNMAERLEAARLFTAMIAAEQVLRDAQFEKLGPTTTPEQDEQIADIHTEYNRRVNEISDWFDAEIKKIKGPDPLAVIRQERDAASDAYDKAPGDAILEDDSGDPVLCALSGAPIYETDEIIEVGKSTVLASLFIPAGVLEMLRGETDEDEAEEIEEAA